MGRLEVLPALYAQVCNVVVELGVGRTELVNLVTNPLVLLRLTAQVMTGCENAQRLQGGRVHLERPLKLGPGLLMVFRLKEKSGLEDPRFDQVFVLLQRLVYLIHHPERAVELHGTGESQERAWVVRIYLEHALQVRVGVRSVVLVEKQLPGQNARFQVTRIEGEGLIVGPEGVLDEHVLANTQVPNGRRHRCEVVRGKGRRPVVDVDEGVENRERRVPIPIGPLDDGEVQAGGVTVDRGTPDRSIELLTGLVDPSQPVEDFARRVGELGRDRCGGLICGLERILVSACFGQGGYVRYIGSSAIVRAQIRPWVGLGDLLEGLDGRLIRACAELGDGFVQRLGRSPSRRTESD